MVRRSGYGVSDDGHGCRGSRAQLAKLNEGAGVLSKMRRDPRVTKVGGWLRRGSLDGFRSSSTWSPVKCRSSGPDRRRPGNRALRRPHAAKAQVQTEITGLWQVSGRSSCPGKRRKGSISDTWRLVGGPRPADPLEDRRSGHPRIRRLLERRADDEDRCRLLVCLNSGSVSRWRWGLAAVAQECSLSCWWGLPGLGLHEARPRTGALSAGSGFRRPACAIDGPQSDQPDDYQPPSIGDGAVGGIVIVRPVPRNTGAFLFEPTPHVDERGFFCCIFDAQVMRRSASTRRRSPRTAFPDRRAAWCEGCTCGARTRRPSSCAARTARSSTPSSTCCRISHVPELGEI